MSSINRATLPQAFLTEVNAGLLLPQPEPQYLFAKWALGNRMRAEALSNGAATAMSYFGAMFNGVVPDGLASMARAADFYPDFVRNVDALFGEGMGTVARLQRRKYEGGGYTETDRAVTVDKATSTTGKAIQMENVEIVLREFEGPYDSGASEIRPYALYDFAQKWENLKTKGGLVGETKHHLMRDAMKWLDTVIRDRFRSTQYITYTDASISSVSSYTASANQTANLDMLFRAKQALADREWQPFASTGRYVLLVPTVFDAQMLSDVTYRELSKQHADGRNQIFGYIGSIQNVDLFECSTLKSYAASDTVPGDSNTVPSGSTVYEALLVGPGAVAHGMPTPFEAFYADDTDYGKYAKVIWRSAQAFQTVDQRGIQRLLFQQAS